MYQELLQRLATEQRQAGSSPQPPCTDEELQRLLDRARQELRIVPPAGYLDFLRLSNGLDWNGVVIYAANTTPIAGHPDRIIPDIVEMNLNYRDDSRFEDLLVIGSNGMDLYTCRISQDVFEIYDEVPHELLETLDTFDELMTKALTRSLQ